MLWFIISILIIGLDQLSKLYFSAKYELGQATTLISGVLEFRYWHNRGAAFGIFQDARWFFIILTIAVLAAVFVYIYKKRPKDGLLLTGLTLILSGAVGNLIDRVRLGYVVDFIYISLIDFPIFNIADMAVSIGAVLLGIYVLLSEMREKRDGNA